MSGDRHAKLVRANLDRRHDRRQNQGLSALRPHFGLWRFTADFPIADIRMMGLERPPIGMSTSLNWHGAESKRSAATWPEWSIGTLLNAKRM